MTKTTSHGDRAGGSERIVRESMSTIQATAQAAVERAVAAGIGGRGATSIKPRSSVAMPCVGSVRLGKRRATEEIGTLGERLYEALCGTPGETMTVLAPIVGA